MKKQKARLLAWVLVLCMVVALMPNVSVKAADSKIPTVEELCKIADPIVGMFGTTYGSGIEDSSLLIGNGFTTEPDYMSFAGTTRCSDLSSYLGDKSYGVSEISGGYRIQNVEDSSDYVDLLFENGDLVKINAICAEINERLDYETFEGIENVPYLYCPEEEHSDRHLYVANKTGDKAVVYSFGKDAIWQLRAVVNVKALYGVDLDAYTMYYVISDEENGKSYKVCENVDPAWLTLSEICEIADPIMVNFGSHLGEADIPDSIIGNVNRDEIGDMDFAWTKIMKSSDLSSVLDLNNKKYSVIGTENGYIIKNVSDASDYVEITLNDNKLVKINIYCPSVEDRMDYVEVEGADKVPTLKCADPKKHGDRHIYITEKNGNNAAVYAFADDGEAWELKSIENIKALYGKDLEENTMYYRDSNGDYLICVSDNNPGQDNPGTDNPGQDNPGQDNPGQDNPGQDNPGQDNPGQNNPGQDNPGQDNPGQDNPGQDNPGQDNPGQDNPGNNDNNDNNNSGNNDNNNGSVSDNNSNPGNNDDANSGNDGAGKDENGNSGNDGSVSENNPGNDANNSQNNRIVKGTDYDTLEVSEILKPNGKFKSLTVSENNGILTVNAGTKLLMLNSNWTVKGYVDGRITTDAEAQAAKWNAADDSKASKKALKKYTTVKFSKKANTTKITTKKNKKVAGSVYAVKLVDEKGNTIILNIERDEINKAVKKTKLAKSVSANSVSENALATMKDGSNVKTVNLSLAKLPETAKSRFNNNAITWKLGSGKKAVKLEVNKIVTVSTKKGTVAQVMLTDDANVKVLSGNVKGTVKLSATIDRKTFKTSVKVK